MRAVVIGVMRHAMHRNPNGIECDACGTQVNFERAPAAEVRAHFQASGWLCSEAGDLCPPCVSMVLAQL